MTTNRDIDMHNAIGEPLLWCVLGGLMVVLVILVIGNAMLNITSPD